MCSSEDKLPSSLSFSTIVGEIEAAMDTPLHCPHCENSDVYVQAIADLRFGRRPHQVSRD